MAQQDRSIYLDHAATTPVRPEVQEALQPFLEGDQYGHPSSMHRRGQAARAAIERSRREIADVLATDPGHVIFTSGGTEADNLAVIGAAQAATAAGRVPRVAISAIEHKAVLETATPVDAMGGEVITLPVDHTGRIEPDAFQSAIEKGLAVVSVMWVNNEMGAIQNVAELAARCAALRVPFHTDAVQAFGKIPTDLTTVPHALVALSGHKIGAINGVGVLVVPDKALIAPLFFGGGQQLGVRPGTENAAGAVAMATAVRLAAERQPQFENHTRSLRDAFEAGVGAAVPDAAVVGQHGARAPHISCLGFPGTDSESLLMQLDLAGVACSAGSACSTGTLEPSHVLNALGVDPVIAVGALRFSFALSNGTADVDRTIAVLPGIVEKTRHLTASLERS